MDNTYSKKLLTLRRYKYNIEDFNPARVQNNYTFATMHASLVTFIVGVPNLSINLQTISQEGTSNGVIYSKLFLTRPNL